MPAWMLYIIAVTSALGGAAFFAERAARMRRSATRWGWVLSILASLLIPAVIASVSVQFPRLTPATVTQNLVPLRAVTSTYLSPAVWIADLPGGAGARS